MKRIEKKGRGWGGYASILVFNVCGMCMFDFVGVMVGVSDQKGQ